MVKYHQSPKNDEVNLKNLIQRGTNKVSDDVGINVESPVNVLKPQAKMQESVSDDELSEIESTVDQNPSQHNYLLHNPYVNASNPYFPNLQAGNMFTVPSNFHNPLSSYAPNINLLQPSVPMYPQQFLQHLYFLILPKHKLHNHIYSSTLLIPPLPTKTTQSLQVIRVRLRQVSILLCETTLLVNPYLIWHQRRGNNTNEQKKFGLSLRLFRDTKIRNSLYGNKVK